jgi:hypothetical protein
MGLVGPPRERPPAGQIPDAQGRVSKNQDLSPAVDRASFHTGSHFLQGLAYRSHFALVVVAVTEIEADGFVVQPAAQPYD